MEEKTTIEITNDRLEQVIKEYLADRTKEKLTETLNLLRSTVLLVPAMLKAPNQPVPCFLRTNQEEQFLAVYTSKEQIPEEPKSQAILRMPFPACNNLVVQPDLKLSGMVINPFSDNLVLKKELVQKLHEADQRAGQMKKVKMTPAQYHAFVKGQVEFHIWPKRLFAEKEVFVEKICTEKEAFINQMFAEAYKEPKLYPYSEKDYSVMALDIAEDLTLIRIDLPEKDMAESLCCRVYMTFNPMTKVAKYYTVEMSGQKDIRILGEVLEDGRHLSYGETPVEGAELQRIMDLSRGEGESPTS